MIVSSGIRLIRTREIQMSNTTSTTKMPAVKSHWQNLTQYVNGITVERDQIAKTATVIWEDYDAEYDITDQAGIESEILYLSQFLNAEGKFDHDAFDAFYARLNSNTQVGA
jgi:hypothetical protein